MSGEGISTADKGEPAYSFRPSLLSGVAEFRLAAGGIEWVRGAQSGHVPYRAVRRLHMSYKPVSMQSHRFVTEVWSDVAPRLQIVSTSWSSMVELQRQDLAYAAFITELHRRVARDAATVRYEQGLNAFAYWPGLALYTVVGLMLAALVVRSLQAHTIGATAFVGALFALFLWQGGNFFRRNRPGRYSPEALPADLMPRHGRWGFSRVFGAASER
jgi:hypothetical protein